MLSLTVLGLCWASIVAASSSFTPARPPALPLAVKSPYLSTWLSAGSDGGNGGYLPGQWPIFWTNQITGWAGLIRVDGTTYTWMGDPSGPALATQTSYEYTSTRSIVKLDVAGKVDLTVTFLSPITPNDLKRQSLIFSYMEVEVTSSDNQTHSVQLYSDISAEWVSGDHSNFAQWDYSVDDDIAYHKVYRQTQQLFSESSNQGEWGNWYYATDSVRGLTYQSGADNTVRSQFANSGVLLNSKDSNYRAINDNYPVFGFAKDLGNFSASSTVSTLFTIGLCQEEAVQFDGASGVVPLTSLWTSYFSSDFDALSFFHTDYPAASDLATSLDNQVESDSVAAAGQDYLTITSLSVRQTMGATQLVGTPDTPYLFLKEISSDGNVQTVDVIFPSHPFFLYANPTLLKYLLDPLFVNQESGQYPNNYSMHDLGSSYPNGTGHTDGGDEKMPLEECGNMLIMTLAYAQRAQDNDYLSKHYSILRQWTSYLVDEALYPANQISTDDFAGALANQTNLALKGIIGINAMAAIANLTGNTADAANYANISSSYIAQWQKLATVPSNGSVPAHTSLSYGNQSSHGLLYNLYANSELGFDLVPQEVYTMQSNFYPTVELKYGVPLDTRHEYTKGDWEVFTAAVASTETRDMFIKDLATWINETPTSLAMTDLYDTITGDYPANTFVARPVVGGTFALLALQGLRIS